MWKGPASRIVLAWNVEMMGAVGNVDNVRRIISVIPTPAFCLVLPTARTRTVEPMDVAETAGPVCPVRFANQTLPAQSQDVSRIVRTKAVVPTAVVEVVANVVQTLLVWKGTARIWWMDASLWTSPGAMVVLVKSVSV